MKKSVLSTALLTILSTAAFADNSIQPSAAATSSLPAATAPATETIKPSTIQAPLPEPVINCKYHIPAQTTNIEQTLLSTWAGKAAVQSFNFTPTTIDAELIELKFCYTDQGWQGFNDALQKSGNIDAIKSQHLTVSSQVDGEVKVTDAKDNQWKVTVPIQAVYQNDKEKLTQLLTIDLLVGRKITGDLGIMQMIATPRQAPGAQQPETPATAVAPAASGQAATQQEPSSTAPQKPIPVSSPVH